MIAVVEHILTIGLHTLIVLFRTNDELLPLTQAGTSGNEVTADHVLLHALEIIDLATDSSLVEHLRCLLERSSRHEALRTKGSAGDTLQHLSRGSGHGIAYLNGTEITTLQRGVLITELTHCNDLTLLQLIRVTGIDNDPRCGRSRLRSRACRPAPARGMWYRPDRRYVRGASSDGQ